MTRGRQPLIALKEAQDFAMKRGQVLMISGERSDHFNLIIFTGSRVTFVKVKRTLSHISDPRDILHDYRREIRHLARIPQNAVAAREFWVRSPRGSWQFFLIGNDRVVEIQADGTIIPGTDHPLVMPEPAVPVALPVKGTNPDQAPAKG
jgi:hypothetical protein